MGEINNNPNNLNQSSSYEFQKNVEKAPIVKYITRGEEIPELKSSKNISDKQKDELRKDMKKMKKMQEGNKSDIKIKLENILGTIGDYLTYSIYFRKLCYFIIIIIFLIIFGNTIFTIATSSWMGMAIVIGCAYLIYVKAYDNAHKIKKIIEEFIDRK